MMIMCMYTIETKVVGTCMKALHIHTVNVQSIVQTCKWQNEIDCLSLY